MERGTTMLGIIALLLISLGILLKEFVLEGIFSAFIVMGLPMHLVVAGLQLLLVGGGFYIWMG
jgi:hypothetical protein